MFSRILVPLDGSERAERALPIAARIARATHSVISLVRVLDSAPMPSSYVGPQFALLPPEAYINTTAEYVQPDVAMEYLATIAASDTLANIETERNVVVGSAAESILEQIETQHADLVIMCSHGRSGFRRWALGSVAQHVTRHAPVPVFVIRENAAIPLHPHPDPTEPLRALAPLDGSTLAEAALTPAVDLLRALSAPARSTLHLVLVVAPFVVDERNMPDALVLEGARSYLSRVAERLRTEYTDVTVTWSVAVELDIAAGVLRVAENGEDAEGAGAFGGSDLIAMATHGYTGLARWALGSIAERILQATKLPLLIVRTQESAAQQQAIAHTRLATDATSLDAEMRRWPDMG